jgi:hypothetical protein
MGGGLLKAIGMEQAQQTRQIQGFKDQIECPVVSGKIFN